MGHGAERKGQVHWARAERVGIEQNTEPSLEHFLFFNFTLKDTLCASLLTLCPMPHAPCAMLFVLSLLKIYAFSFIKQIHAQ